MHNLIVGKVGGNGKKIFVLRQDLHLATFQSQEDLYTRGVVVAVIQKN
jgi:hypothetical protein